MKRSLVLVLGISMLGTTTTQTLPHPTTIAGLAFLTGAGLFAARNATSVKDTVVSTSKTLLGGIKKAAKKDPHFDKKVGISLAGLGLLFLLPHAKMIPAVKNVVDATTFTVKAAGTIIAVHELIKKIQSKYFEEEKPETTTKENS